ncbi:PEP-CTERM sorting domain-containing protein [Chamaesiphon sp. VAR_48_metabat_135_sub]|uniref:PEP-CTERM sorting domain-containing protein n=1 Tax=Chamaesiphon sp. VAR_48_metabat_135_sub TaxID=2964699 RepID=UPI00286B0824|nr:PEP-CTERM sorting domain-containing protein [Chamaesiphon sp. VAR_48_metabat_135_sub]
MNKFSLLSLSAVATAILFAPMSAQAMVAAPVNLAIAASGTEGQNIFASSGVSIGGNVATGGGIIQAPQNITTGTSPVIATYLGSTASYKDLLYLMVDNNRANDVLLFDNKLSAVNSTVDLGSFMNGTQLNFRLHVTETGRDFFTGGSHARVQNYGPDTTLVSFEDDVDMQFNDLSFSLSSTQSSLPLAAAAATDVPEPFTIVGTLLGTTAAFRMKKKLGDSDKV